MRRKFAVLLGTAFVATVGLVACGGAQEAQEQAEEQVQQAQQDVEEQAQEAQEQVELV